MDTGLSDGRPQQRVHLRHLRRGLLRLRDHLLLAYLPPRHAWGHGLRLGLFQVIFSELFSFYVITEHKATSRIFDSCWLEPRLHPKTTRNKIKDASQKFRTLKPIVGRFPTAPNLKLYIGPAEVSRLSI